MAFNKDPIEVGMLFEAVGSGIPYEVTEAGAERDNWIVHAVGSAGRRMERSAPELNDPFKWTRINLDELSPEQRAQTIQGKATAEEAPPAAEPEPAAAPTERTVEAALVPAGWEVLDDAGEWVPVKRTQQVGGARVLYTTDAGELYVSFFTRQRTRPRRS